MPGKLKKRLAFFLRNEFREIYRNEFEQEFKKRYNEQKWEDFVQNESIKKIPYPLNKKVSINLYKENYLSRLIFLEEFELEIVDFIRQNLNAGDCFIDVGANIGFFTLLAADLISADGLVLAFEPTPDTYEKLSENINLNGFTNTLKHKTALSDFNGTSVFNVSVEGYDAFNSFSTPVHGNEYKKEEIEVQALDNFYTLIEAYKDRILVKIDVEGWEYNVIKGAKEILTTLNPVLILEFNDENTNSSPQKCSDLYRLLESYGYELFKLSNNQLVHKKNEAYFNYQNLIAIHKNSLLNERYKIVRT